MMPIDWTADDAQYPSYTAPGGYGEAGGGISIFQSRENPEEVYFFSAFGDTPWLTLGELRPMKVAGDGNEADEKIALQMKSIPAVYHSASPLTRRRLAATS